MSAGGGSPRVLLVDGDRERRRAAARVLVGAFDVDTAEDGKVARDLLLARRADVVLVDLDAEGARALLDAIARDHPGTSVIAIAPWALAARAFEAGAHDVVPPPGEAPELATRAIARAIERRKLTTSVRDLRAELASHGARAEIVASSRVMLDVLRKARRAAEVAAPLLIVGEPGTGRALLARHVAEGRHPRAQAPPSMVSAALPEDVVQRALFDPEAGAFAQAEEGAEALVIEDVHALSAEGQDKLEAALDRAGPRGRARIISTAEPTIRARVAEGSFRRDLYYKLSAILIEVPKLSARRDDIPLLAVHLLKRLEGTGTKARRFGPEAIKLLRAHPWEGNVSELAQAVEHAAVMARGEIITPSDLPFGPPRKQAPLRGAIASEDGSDLSELPYAEAKKIALLAFDRAYVERVLARASGVVTKAAREAGMDRANFRKLVKRAQTTPRDQNS